MEICYTFPFGFAEHGPVTGRPLIWFHGSPGARRQIAPEAREAAYERGVRIIAVERPGIGASTPHCYPAVRDFAVDIEHLANALDLRGPSLLLAVVSWALPSMAPSPFDR